MDRIPILKLRDLLLVTIQVDMYALVAPQIQTRGLTYESVPCDPSIVVRTDGEKVQQILLNLLSNAVKFTDSGGHVRLECVARGSVAAIRVVDTGLGIPAGKLEAIFEPFVQVDQNFTRTGQGTGLGLSISRDLARAMGGDIVVESMREEASAARRRSAECAPRMSPTR